MPKYSLHYFAVNGRAAISRAILTYAKADWKNILINREDWPTIKKSGLCEFEQVPVLEVDGKKMCESNAINLYLGETFNLLGKDSEENYQIYNLLMTHEDLGKPLSEFMSCKDESKKNELKQKIVEKLNFFLGKFEKRYIELGKGKYFLGDKFTLADIFLAVAIPTLIDLLGINDFPYETSPNVGTLVKRIKENELKEFYEKFFIKSNK